jgi:uncharacterized membrane protein YkoI
MWAKIWIAAALVAASVTGAEPARAADASLCLSAEQQRSAITGRRVVPLGRAVRTVHHGIGGEVIRARLCNGRDGLVYILTVLSWNGRVASATVDAVTGALIGRR